MGDLLFSFSKVDDKCSQNMTPLNSWKSCAWEYQKCKKKKRWGNAFVHTKSWKIWTANAVFFFTDAWANALGMWMRIYEWKTFLWGRLDFIESVDRDFRPTNDGDMLGKKLLFGVIKLLILLQKANEKKKECPASAKANRHNYLITSLCVHMHCCSSKMMVLLVTLAQFNAVN